MRVAAVIATKNGAATIASTVASVIDQCDVFVVSDGSTDNTGAVAREAGAEILALHVNVGKPAAIYKTVHHFGIFDNYDLVTILDDDTIVEPNFVAECVAAFDDDVVIVCGQTKSITAGVENNPLVQHRAYSYWWNQITLRQGQSAMNVMTCISGSNSMFRCTTFSVILKEKTPYIVDDTAFLLDAQRMFHDKHPVSGKTKYAPKAIANIQEPTTVSSRYKQELRWMYGTFQGIIGHKVGRRRTWFDFWYVMLMIDWLTYIVGPVILLALWLNFFSWWGVVIYFAGYTIRPLVGAIALRQWRILAFTPVFIVIDFVTRYLFIHALVKAIRKPTVESCVWDSPARQAVC